MSARVAPSARRTPMVRRRCATQKLARPTMPRPVTSSSATITPTSRLVIARSPWKNSTRASSSVRCSVTTRFGSSFLSAATAVLITRCRSCGAVRSTYDAPWPTVMRNGRIMLHCAALSPIHNDGRIRLSTIPTTRTPRMFPSQSVLPSGFSPGHNFCAIARVMITIRDESGIAFWLLAAAAKSMYSSDWNQRPAINFAPSTRPRFSPVYKVALSVGCVCVGFSSTEVFDDELVNGSWLASATACTPGIIRNAARSSCVRARASGCEPIVETCTCTSSCMATPLGMSIRCRRWPIRNTALQTIAQVSAISSTIRVAVILCLRSVERIGRISMSASLQLQCGGDATSTPRRQDAGEQRRTDRKGERHQQHHGIEVRELCVIRRLQTHQPQTQLGEQQAADATGQADQPRFDQQLSEHRAARGAQRAAHADLAGTAQELRQHQADGVHEAHQQETEGEPRLQPHVFRHDLLERQPLHHVAQTHVGRALETAQHLLFLRVMDQERLVRSGLRRRVELHPELQPGAGRRFQHLLVG